MMRLAIRDSIALCGLPGKGFIGTMANDVRLYVSHCKRCVLSKALEPEARAPLVSIVTSAPLELVCIDFWSAEDTSQWMYW